MSFQLLVHNLSSTSRMTACGNKRCDGPITRVLGQINLHVASGSIHKTISALSAFLF